MYILSSLAFLPIVTMTIYILVYSVELMVRCWCRDVKLKEGTYSNIPEQMMFISLKRIISFGSAAITFTFALTMLFLQRGILEAESDMLDMDMWHVIVGPCSPDYRIVQNGNDSLYISLMGLAGGILVVVSLWWYVDGDGSGSRCVGCRGLLQPWFDEDEEEEEEDEEAKIARKRRERKEKKMRKQKVDDAYPFQSTDTHHPVSATELVVLELT
jgi:hypothetical protein